MYNKYKNYIEINKIAFVNDQVGNIELVLQQLRVRLY